VGFTAAIRIHEVRLVNIAEQEKLSLPSTAV